MLDRDGKTWRTCALIVAGGKGVRLGSLTPKQYLPLRGAPVLAWSVAAFDRMEIVDEAIVVVPEADLAYVAEAVVDAYGFDKVRRIVAGGKERQESVAAGLDAIEGDDAVVLVHDGVRPFVSADIITRATERACDTGAALVAVPVVDTIKRVDEHIRVVETVSRERLWAAQTPQAFRVDILRSAMDRASADGYTGTDEAEIVARSGVEVAVVTGEGENIKITTPDDLARAERIAEGREPPC
jgi:2-C-methyl-D-erythritol 4-phosphate cytidylyltransferase